MTKRIFSWLGREFVELSSEAGSGATATEEAREIFRRFDRRVLGPGYGEGTGEAGIWRARKESGFCPARRGR